VSNPKLHITIVFGKNENDPTRSINASDLEFFKQFPNIEIRYEKRLHAKYYANENAAIITSMNLYSFSQDNNIESGVLMSPPLTRGIAKNWIGTESLDDQAWGYFQRVIDQSALLYRKVPEFENGFMGLTRKYIKSVIENDNLDSFITKEKKVKEPQAGFGYCIVTGTKIPFNIEQPLSKETYKTWTKKKEANYKGSFCHFSGEVGETTFSKPILKKNWRKAQETADTK